MTSEQQAARVTVRAAMVSVVTGVGLLGLKGIAYAVTGSAAILSDAAESVVNVVAANVALVGLAVAARPPDDLHQYGHGKAEHLSGATEGAMIMVAGALVTVYAARRLLRPTPLDHVPLGLLLVAVAAAANLLAARFLQHVAREHRSPALAADAQHLYADVATSVAVLAGVGLQHATGQLWLDPLIGGLLGLYIVAMGWRVYRDALQGLMDIRLPETEERTIRAVFDAHRDSFVDYHALRTRRAGRDRFVDVHLVVHRTVSVGTAHDLADRLESHIRETLPGSDVTIHVEPCEPDCARCNGQTARRP
ncbi:MAG: cation diffusion facilitator family transporter [Armatimonadota bacterium]|nr:cation diffusion facilitator family transporter [Armatimonadota bacterium]MDR5697153.1 cation diffusion facilitator family transporter [Armatimonadota bacterium]